MAPCVVPCPAQVFKFMACSLEDGQFPGEQMGEESQVDLPDSVGSNSPTQAWVEHLVFFCAKP